jgi:hypothetical protein
MPQYLFLGGLFYDPASRQMIYCQMLGQMNDEMERIWKETVVA